MNIRKNIDYSEMYATLDNLMAKELTQMELYCEIGKAVCRRTEKGAAVMASEYLNKQYPDVKGFSPRSLRRMRDFYRTYENHPALLSRAMKLGWIQNVVIMEAELTIELREWYMRAAKQFGWSKMELIANIVANSHDNVTLHIEEDVCQSAERKEKQFDFKMYVFIPIINGNYDSIWRVRRLWLNWKKGRRRRPAMWWSPSSAKHIYAMVRKRYFWRRKLLRLNAEQEKSFRKDCFLVSNVLKYT